MVRASLRFYPLGKNVPTPGGGSYLADHNGTARKSPAVSFRPISSRTAMSLDDGAPAYRFFKNREDNCVRPVFAM